MLPNHKSHLAIKSRDLAQSHVTNKKCYISPTRVAMATKLGRIWTPTYKATCPFDHVVVRDHVTN